MQKDEDYKKLLKQKLKEKIGMLKITRSSKVKKENMVNTTLENNGIDKEEFEKHMKNLTKNMKK
jgi:hypothetical protein